MAKLVGSTQTPSYDDFEPFCNWLRKQDGDTLVLHLSDFKKQQMKIQISNLGILKISGERAIDATKRSRFYKEVKVSNECDVSKVHAKFENGLLTVVMPKEISAAPAPNPPPTQPVQTATNSELPQKSSVSFSRWRSYTKKTVKFGLAVALVSAIGAYILYGYYNSSRVGDFNSVDS